MRRKCVCALQALSNTLYALARLHHTPSPDFMAAFELRSLDVLKQSADKTVVDDADKSGFETQHLSNIAWALATLQCGAGAAWWQHYLAAVQARLPQLNTQALSNIIWALATLDERPPGQWLDRFVLEVARKAPDFNSQGCSNVVWALAKIRAVSQVQRPYSSMWLLRHRAVCRRRCTVSAHAEIPTPAPVW